MFRIIYMTPRGSSDPHARSRGEIMPDVCADPTRQSEKRDPPPRGRTWALPPAGRPTPTGADFPRIHIQEYTHATQHTPPHTAAAVRIAHRPTLRAPPSASLLLEQRNETLDPSALRAPHRSAALFTTALGGSVSRLSFGERFRAAPPSPPHPCPPPPTLVHSLELEP